MNWRFVIGSVAIVLATMAMTVVGGLTAIGIGGMVWNGLGMTVPGFLLGALISFVILRMTGDLIEKCTVMLVDVMAGGRNE